MNRQFWEDTVLYFHQYNRKQVPVDWMPGYFLCFLISGQIWGATTNSVGSWLLYQMDRDQALPWRSQLPDLSLLSRSNSAQVDWMWVLLFVCLFVSELLQVLPSCGTSVVRDGSFYVTLLMIWLVVQWKPIFIDLSLFFFFVVIL